MANTDEHVPRIVAAIERGEVVIIPTDTVYGLAADPTSTTAMNRLFGLKQRPDGVPVAVLAASPNQARQLVVPSAAFDDLAERYWPGALTIVTPSVAEAGLQIGDTANADGVLTVGVRVPDHDLIRQCAQRFGPIAATSANLHGSPTITDPTELADTFGESVDVIIDGGVLAGVASTVVDISNGQTTVLRQGVVRVD